MRRLLMAMILIWVAMPVLAERPVLRAQRIGETLTVTSDGESRTYRMIYRPVLATGRTVLDLRLVDVESEKVIRLLYQEPAGTLMLAVGGNEILLTFNQGQVEFEGGSCAIDEVDCVVEAIRESVEVSEFDAGAISAALRDDLTSEHVENGEQIRATLDSLLEGQLEVSDEAGGSNS